MKKLRNKKTGEIAKNVSSFDTRDFKIGIEYEDSLGYSSRVAYDSLAELNEEWEDVEDINVTNIPLIKNEKIRKAVRAWADGNDVINVQFDAFWRGFRHNNSTITVWEDLPFEDGKIYSIAELCGEEE